MASKNAGRIVAGAVAVAVVVIVAFVLMKSGDKETDVVVDAPQGSCVVTAKANIDNAKKDKFVIWVIDNKCRPPVMVTVGNFRTDASLNADDCSQPTLGGATWPFQEDMNQIIHRQNRNRIPLKIKTNADLPNGHTYYFDICVGDNGGRKSDPRLVIDP
jgi:hypothetical protein